MPDPGRTQSHEVGCKRKPHDGQCFPDEAPVTGRSPSPEWQWCEWVERHPPHLWACQDENGGTAIFACTGEGDE